MAFYLKCPDCDNWARGPFSESYRSMMYRLDAVKQYEQHYQRDHAPIPLPEVIDAS